MIAEGVTDQVIDTIDFAKTIAKEYAHSQFSSCHMLRSVLRKEVGLVPFMDGIHKDIGYMREWADVRIEGYPKGTGPVPEPMPDAQIDAVLREADFVKIKLGRAEADPMCLLIALCTPGVGFSYEQLKSFPVTRTELFDNIDAPKVATEGHAASGIQTGNNGSAASTNAKSLGEYCVDKTELAAQGKIDPIVGRDREVRQVSEILGRRSKPNVIIIGDPGVGKTALVDGFALNINEGNVPTHLKGARLFELDLGALVAGASYKGEVEDRIKKVVNAVKSFDKAILFIDEIHALMDENRGLSGCANLLKPELARGELTVIGATTNDEYREFLEGEEAFMRRFEIVRVEEPTDDVCQKMLETVVPFYEQHHSLKVENAGIVEAIRLARRYMKERRLPDAALDLIDRTLASIRMMNDTSGTDISSLTAKLAEIADDDKSLEKLRYFNLEMNNLLSPVILGKLEDETDVLKIEDVGDLRKHLTTTLVKLEQLSGTKKEVVEKDDIAAVVAYKTGIPIGKVQSQEKERLLNMEETLKGRVIGQDHAIKILADSILESRSGLTKAELPIGSFFFLGPTGTGKTELAKALAEFLFSDENSLIRFDMSEFKEEHSAALLYGAPPGYVGYKEGGLLVNKIRQQPYSIVLFDEIEKAHPSVFDLFLQILDEGKLDDRLGKEGDFSNSVILFTSNIGSEHIITEFEKGDIPKSSDLMEIMGNHFRPEFLARLTEILPFRPIHEDTVEFIFGLQLRQLEKALEKQHILLDLDKETRKRLAMEGFTPKYGARPLRGVIRNRLRRPISRMIIGQKVKKGQTIQANFVGDELEFKIFDN
ncbi:MAG: ATP-dependent Clp protease ATP-binding subunit [Flavobacteriales bacterium]|nr:ATP-dependent Clp protease ATP-binding subunit [Flavobacteriales bacterium]